MFSDPPHHLRRREFIAATGVASAAVLAAPAFAAAAEAPAFEHGVASGDPLPDSVILWTRVTTSGPADVDVKWEVAADAGFSDVVARGTFTTGPERDHTVKVDATGLDAGAWYYYRFEAGGTHSPTGRTRTAPAATDQPERLRFGVVSCTNWQAGHFAAYRRLAERADLDAVLHLGDYLYEYGPGEYGSFRPHDPPHEMLSLDDYRRRHAQYKTDPSLRKLHAEYPWIITWDDHETADDAWSGGADNHTEGTEGNWKERRAAALRAYDEWMPVRLGEDRRIYRRLRFGKLAELSMLDLRTYRSKQLTTEKMGDADDPDRTIAGAEQLSFLRASLSSDRAQWKLIGNPVMFGPLLLPPLPEVIGRPISDVTGIFPADGAPLNLDQWDGYQHERRQLIKHLADSGITDTVFLTGDIHTSWAMDVPLDAGTYPLSRTVATEFVVPSVTSDNIDEMTGTPPRTASISAEQALRTLNRHLKFVELDSHGFSVLDVTAARVQMDWYFLADREDPDSPAKHAKSLQVIAGTQKVRAAASPLDPRVLRSRPRVLRSRPRVLRSAGRVLHSGARVLRSAGRVLRSAARVLHFAA